MGRKKSTLDEVLYSLAEVSNCWWQFGAAITAVLMFITYKVLMFAHASNTQPDTLIAGVFKYINLMIYILPIMSAGVTLFFALLTLKAYQRSH